MSPSTEWLDLFQIDLRYLRVSQVDHFEGMQAVVRYLREQADREHCYSVGGFSGEIRSVAFFCGDNLLMLTSAGEVMRVYRPELSGQELDGTHAAAA